MELSIQERLKDLRVERGLTLEQLAEKTHLSKSALGSYEGDNFKDISHYALIELAKFYEVTVDYLLGRSQTRNHPNADLADLHLSDDMIELLKSGLVDNSLLCELATHPDFPRLMADLEIYVNGVAGKQVQSANAIVDAVSATIMKQHNPGLTDPQLRQLIAAHIDDDSFCRYVIQQDINKIAFDLQEAHKDDFFSVPEDNPLEDFLQTAEETTREDSDPEQAAMAFICKRLKLNYGKLSEEEKRLGSVRYLLQSAEVCRALGGKRIIFHSGSCGKQSREAALEKALDTMRRAVEALDEAGYGDMTLCPETMGKIGQLGTLDEVLALCGVDKRITPCIDFGHLNARTLGGIQSRADYAAILDRMGEALGDERARRFHVHFSRIEFSAGGEKRHWTFAETQFGPEPQPLMELLAERRLEPVIICESAGTQAEDAQAMQRMYEAARGEQPLRQR